MEETDFLKNNKAMKMFFKLIKMNLLCTLLYTKMQIMQGSFWGKQWLSHSCSSPLPENIPLKKQ